MSGEFTPREEGDLVAAEYVLRLLEPEARMGARGRIAADPAFAASVEAWERRLAPLYDGFRDAAPPPDLWPRIERSLEEWPGETGADNVVALRRRTRVWQGVAGAMTALAAGLALVLGLRVAQPDPPLPQPRQVEAPVLVASLASEDGAAALAVAFQPAQGTMLVTPARLQPSAGHDHELWMIPRAGAAPVSLGVVRGAGPRRLTVPAALREAMAADAALALSVEPAGGSPTGSPTGPVIASGPLTRI